MILAVDGNGLLHTYYHVADRNNPDGNQEKNPDEILERFLTRLERLRASLLLKAKGEPVKCVCVFDHQGLTIRKCILPGYKAGRTRDPVLDLAVRQAQVAVATSQSWIGFMSPPGYEADDVLATIAATANERVLLHSADKDINQCLQSGKVTIIKSSRVDVEARALDIQFFTESDMVKKFGVGPRRWVDYQCLVGDTTDNVEGADGVGPVTAVKILQKFESRFEDINVYRLPLNTRQRMNWWSFVDRLPILREVFRLNTGLKMPEIRESIGEY